MNCVGLMDRDPVHPRSSCSIMKHKTYIEVAVGLLFSLNFSLKDSYIFISAINLPLCFLTPPQIITPFLGLISK